MKITTVEESCVERSDWESRKCCGGKCCTSSSPEPVYEISIKPHMKTASILLLGIIVFMFGVMFGAMF